jgi:hypothetical protein
MLETQLLGRKFFSSASGNWNRGRISGPDDPEVARSDLDLARLHLRVAHFHRTRHDFAFDRNHCLEAEPTGSLNYVGRRRLRVEGHLDQASTITKIEKNDSAEISRAVYPAAEFDFGTDVGRSELSG